MFLKSLTLKGFKSFAEPTTLELEPGVTVVVGPNGSGKSNIVDAVAWVLGAQGPRTLRSSKMEDVIFSGSARKPALGRAEVCLTIDNAEGLVPVDLPEVSISRTLFRSGDSEYAINGVPCRLLDVQELLADTGVGRQQHVIVSQGQLGAVLDSRPEDRRLVIEEAAGVLKYRRRRERAQRRLEASEASLHRLQDLLREVRRQLRPLERQAEAARRHDALVEELRALRLHLAGREVAALRGRVQVATRARAELAAAEAALQEALGGLDERVAVAEAAVPAPGHDDLGDALARHEGLRERARGLAAVLAERRRSAERELRATVDEDVISSLEAEAAGLRTELERVEDAAAALVPVAEELRAAEAALGDDRAAFDQQWGDGPPGRGPGLAEARGELAARRAVAERDRAAITRLQARRAVLAQRAEALAAEIAVLEAEVDDAEQAERALSGEVEAAESRRARAEAAVAAAEAALAGADQERRTWEARVEALSLALAHVPADGAHLPEVDGVVGALAELVEVDEGWEAAFEAAAGDALGALVVDDVPGARRALARLHAAGASGAVLTLEPLLPSREATPGAGGQLLRAHVRSPLPGVERLLDALLAGVVAVGGGWEEALDLVLAHPGLVAVTRAGDRFAAGGWRVGATAAPAARAALEEARAGVGGAAAAAAAAGERLADARVELDAARAREAHLAAQLDASDARLGAAADARQRLEGERGGVGAEDEAVRAQLAELEERVRRDEARVAELESVLPDLEAEEAARAEQVGAMREARRRLDERTAAVSALRTDLEVRAGGLEERRSLLGRRLGEVEDRLRGYVELRAGAARRRERLEALHRATLRLGAVVTERLALVESVLVRLREERRRRLDVVRAAADRLERLRHERAGTEARLAELRERAQRAELEQAEAHLRLETALDAVRRELDCEPEVAEAAPCPDLPAGTTAPARARELERELRLLGPVNPLALQEFEALESRHRFLEAQLEDVRSGRRELAKLIRAVDAEIVALFSAAFADVSENFTDTFATLFPGGTGRLRLSDPDNLLETGIEVEARPSGKHVRKLSLLSGGERSLTALAFLFAVFRSRPSPFYLLDEVEAALDDVNLHRFLELLDRFRHEAQLLVVTHQKRTMEAADCLYGVTMEPGGSSKVLSERVERVGARA